ncbi:unnamed protein product [Schistosoma spindalis]|nr:unnamed protein product [Schistosoma spindale]
MNTFYCSIFIVVILYAYFDMVDGIPEPQKFVDEDGVPVRRKPTTPIKISPSKIPVNRTMKAEAKPSKEEKQKSSHQKDKKAKSSSSTMTIGCPIIFMITPFVISEFLL